jgi:CubicO group peptidase (beta-lactamase class C family)
VSAFATVSAEIASGLAELQVPGVALGVLHGGEEQVAGFGVTSVEHPLEVTPETLFQTGSITKTFTGTALVLLAERGEVDLDAPVRTYVPELRLADEDVSARVTTRHLLTHTGGWAGDYFDDLGWGDGALARMVERLASLPQLTPLGEVWSYNNAGFYVAGRVIENVTGIPYEDAIRELILDPLGMERSCFTAGDAITHRVAVGHVASPGGIEVGRPWPIGRGVHPAGGIVSNVVELLRYARFHLDAPPHVRAMQEIQAEAGTFADWIGVTWFLRDVGGTRTVAHGGTTFGQNAWLTLVPERDFACVVLTNSTRGARLHGRATARALREYLGVAAEEPLPLELDESALREYEGSYDAPSTRADLEVGDGRLVLRLTPKGGFPKPDSPPYAPPLPAAELAVVAPDRVVVADGELAGSRGEFLRDGGGEVEWLRFGGRIMRRS